MLMGLFQNRDQLSLSYVLLVVFSYVALVFVMMPVHELAHAWSANKLGDNTPYWHGRLRFNPLAHLDPWGTAMIFLFGFGFAKPVPVNPRNFRNPKQGMALTALAGPVSNLLMAAASVGIFRILYALPLNITVLNYAWVVLIDVFASVNIGLAVFNLIPVPPLDGSKILALFVPDRLIYSMERHSQYITWGIMALLFSGYLSVPLSNARMFIMNLLFKIFMF